MKRFQWAILTLLVILAQYAYADSISTFRITRAVVFVGAGSDNAGFLLTGPGISIAGDGGIACQRDWCDGQIFPAGGPSAANFFHDQIFLEENRVEIGGHVLTDDTLDLTPFLELTTFGGFTFPVNATVGATFKGCQPAAMPDSFTGTAGSGDEFTTFILQMPTGGKFCSTWTFVAASDEFPDEFPAGFVFTEGKFVASTVPEPGTLGLVGCGLAGIVAAVRKRSRQRALR